ncbi:hypothetical protein CALCODRAFT_283289 [Calocera cornea HHB12733]|uniref:Uncharacterized protein n=1 Tax=Calocera cornea HHB12733 TaxID=1353952 RepID=A0A165FYR8_9BASI|nr:hypothetical protein CALCODRAFT_283289 [Calocera cornea HHB12733]
MDDGRSEGGRGGGSSRPGRTVGCVDWELNWLRLSVRGDVQVSSELCVERPTSVSSNVAERLLRAPTPHRPVANPPHRVDPGPAAYPQSAHVSQAALTTCSIRSPQNAHSISTIVRVGHQARRDRPPFHSCTPPPRLQNWDDDGPELPNTSRNTLGSATPFRARHPGTCPVAYHTRNSVGPTLTRPYTLTGRRHWANDDARGVECELFLYSTKATQPNHTDYLRPWPTVPVPRQWSAGNRHHRARSATKPHADGRHCYPAEARPAGETHCRGKLDRCSEHGVGHGCRFITCVMGREEYA